MDWNIMKASEAIELTKKSMETVVIEKFINHIDSRISKQAKKGMRSVHNPQSGSSDDGFYFYLSEDEKKAVRLHYENNGFTWSEHENPDPGHPCSSAYDTLEW